MQNNVGTFKLTLLYSFGSRSQLNRTGSLQFRCCIFFLSWRSVGRFNSSWKRIHRTAHFFVRFCAHASKLSDSYYAICTDFVCLRGRRLMLHPFFVAPGKTKLFSLMQSSFHHPVHCRRNHPWIDPKQVICDLQVCCTLSGGIWRIFLLTKTVKIDFNPHVDKQYMGTLLNTARGKKKVITCNNDFRLKSTIASSWNGGIAWCNLDHKDSKKCSTSLPARSFGTWRFPRAKQGTEFRRRCRIFGWWPLPWFGRSECHTLVRSSTEVAGGPGTPRVHIRLQ